MWDFEIFDQAQVQDRESSHYGLWQISIGSNHKLLYNGAKQYPRQHKYTLGLRESQLAKFYMTKQHLIQPSVL